MAKENRNKVESAYFDHPNVCNQTWEQKQVTKTERTQNIDYRSKKYKK